MQTSILKQKKHIPSHTNNFDEAAANKLRDVSRVDSDIFLDMLNSSADGLTPAQVHKKQKLVGLNEIEHEKAPAWYRQLIIAFVNPFTAVLIILATISFVMDVLLTTSGNRDYKTVIVISVMVLMSSLLRFWQEYSSNRAAEQLKSMVKTTTTVLRKGKGETKIEIKAIVPGDIALLSAGDMIPADAHG